MENLLLKSIQDGRIRQTGLLLKVGKDVNEADGNGETGIMKAMVLKNSQIRMNIVKMLMKNNADISLIDNKKRNVFMWACYYGRINEIKYIIATCDLNTMQIDNQDYEGNTGIIYAVKKGHSKLVSELVNYLHEFKMQWILSLKNNNGFTPLMEAFRNGNFETAKCLLDDGKVKIDNLTYNVLHNEEFEVTWLKMRPQKLIKEIMKTLSDEDDPEPSNILRLLITNESFRNVALKIRENKEKRNEDRAHKLITRVPNTAPGRMQKKEWKRHGCERQESEMRRTLPRQKSIKRMLPTIMNMYEDQLTQNYRPASKNQFVPYASMSRQLRTLSITSPTGTGITRPSKSYIGNLPDFSKFNRLLDPRFSRASRSISVQLPQMNSWSLLRKKLRTNLINDI